MNFCFVDREINLQYDKKINDMVMQILKQINTYVWNIMGNIVIVIFPYIHIRETIPGYNN